MTGNPTTAFAIVVVVTSTSAFIVDCADVSPASSVTYAIRMGQLRQLTGNLADTIRGEEPLGFAALASGVAPG